MAVYSYSAIAADSSSTSGVLTADTPRQVRDLLRARGLTVERVTPYRSIPVFAILKRPLGRPHGGKVTAFIRELSTLLGVGVPLLEAIDTLARQQAGGLRAALLALRDRIAAGSGLAEAMAEQPHLFDEMCVSITEVGENAGTLETVLDQLAQFRERSLTFKNRIVTAMIYPAVVLLMTVGVAILLMTVVVPNLIAALQESGRPLPLPTRVVKAISDVLVNQWWLLLLLAAGAVVAGGAFLRSASGRMLWHRAQLRIPVLGDLLRKQAVVRIAVVMAALLRSDIVFVRALQIAQRSTHNRVLRAALARCEEAVNAGQDIGAALAETNAFPPLVVQIFALGQQSGRLEEMLERLAADYDRHLATAAQRLTAVLEPVFILIMVTIVGFIALATILPMLEAANAF